MRERKVKGEGKAKTALLDRSFVCAVENPTRIAAGAVATVPPRRFFGEGASSTGPPVGTPEGLPKESGYDFYTTVGFALILFLGIVLGIVGLLTIRWLNGIANCFRREAPPAGQPARKPDLGLRRSQGLRGAPGLAVRDHGGNALP